MTSVRTTLTKHSLLFLAGVGILSLGLAEVYLFRQGAPTLAKFLTIPVWSCIYSATVAIGLLLSRRGDETSR